MSVKKAKYYQSFSANLQSGVEHYKSMLNAFNDNGESYIRKMRNDFDDALLALAELKISGTIATT